MVEETVRKKVDPIIKKGQGVVAKNKEIKRPISFYQS